MNFVIFVSEIDFSTTLDVQSIICHRNVVNIYIFKL